MGRKDGEREKEAEKRRKEGVGGAMKGRRGRKQMMRNGERDKPGPRGGRGGRGESRENEKAAL